MLREKKVGLVLGGGGARGIAHIGVLKVLEKEGIKIDYIVGVSMGAVVGAMNALGARAAELEAFANEHKSKRAIARFIDLGGMKKSIIKGNKIRELLKKITEDKDFKDTKIPLRIIATDLGSGKDVVISQGSLVEAIMASICVPGVFPPVKIDNKYLIDGGVVNPTPLDVALRKKGIDLVIGVDIIMRKNERIVEPNIITTLFKSYEIMRTHAVKAKLQQKKNHKVIMITPHTRSSIESFKFDHISEFIRAGEIAAKKKLPQILKKLS